jgi:hypothetical protein
MPRGKKFSAEQMIAKLREAEVELARGKKAPEAAKKIGVAGLPPPGAGGDPAGFDCFGYASAIEAGWRWDKPNPNLKTGSIRGVRSRSGRECLTTSRILQCLGG